MLARAFGALGAAGGTDLEEGGAVLVVAAEAAEGEAGEEVEGGELQAGTGADVAGAEADGDAGPGGDRIEHGSHAGVGVAGR